MSHRIRLLRCLMIFLTVIRAPIVHADTAYVPSFDIRVYEFNQFNIPDSFFVNHGSLYPPEGLVILKDSASGQNYIADYQGLKRDSEDGSPYMYFENITPVQEGDGLPGIPGVSDSPVETAPGSVQNGSQSGAAAGSSANPMLDGVGGAARAGVASGVVAGIANEIVNRFVITDAQRADWAAIQSAARYQGSLVSHQRNLVAVADGKLQNLGGKLFQIDGLQPQIEAEPHVFQSSDPGLVKNLNDIQNQLIYAPSLHPQAENLRGLGLGLVQESDSASVAGDAVSAEALEEYAKATADLLVGWDPVTGTARSVYEAFTGTNLITGETLSEFERGAAVFGTVTFGYGQKIAKGVTSISKAARAMAGRLKFVKGISGNNSWVKAMKSGALRMDPKSLGQFDRFKFMVRSEAGSASKPFTGLAKDVLEQNPSELFRYSDLAYETRNIKVPLKYSVEATQELSRPALDTYDAIKKGDRMVVRQGVRGESKIASGGGKPQYWAHDKAGVGTVEFAHRMGAYSEVPDFVEYGQIKEGAKYVVREAKPGRLPDGRITAGGGHEVVVAIDGVDPVELKLLPR